MKKHKIPALRVEDTSCYDSGNRPVEHVRSTQIKPMTWEEWWELDSKARFIKRHSKVMIGSLLMVLFCFALDLHEVRYIRDGEKYSYDNACGAPLVVEGLPRRVLKMDNNEVKKINECYIEHYGYKFVYPAMYGNKDVGIFSVKMDTHIEHYYKTQLKKVVFSKYTNVTIDGNVKLLPVVAMDEKNQVYKDISAICIYLGLNG